MVERRRRTARPSDKGDRDVGIFLVADHASAEKGARAARRVVMRLTKSSYDRRRPDYSAWLSATWIATQKHTSSLATPAHPSQHPSCAYAQWRQQQRQCRNYQRRLTRSS